MPPLLQASTRSSLLTGAMVRQLSSLDYARIKRDEVASENKCESFVLISDELSHTKHSVLCYHGPHFQTKLTEKFPAIKKINIFSVGSSQQFKQRFLFSNLHIWEEEYCF